MRFKQDPESHNISKMSRIQLKISHHIKKEATDCMGKDDVLELYTSNSQRLQRRYHRDTSTLYVEVINTLGTSTLETNGKTDNPSK